MEVRKTHRAVSTELATLPPGNPGENPSSDQSNPVHRHPTERHAHIHGLADGAPWIVDQYEEQFGANHGFLIDFYHTSEYLATASDELNEDPAGRQDWYERQRRHLKADKADAVINELTNISREYPDKQAVETCLRISKGG